MTNRNGDLVSAQVSVAREVDFSGGNFKNLETERLWV